MLRLRFHRAAQAEAQLGVLHYLEEAEDVSVARRFEDALERAIAHAMEAPEAWPVVDEPTQARRTLLDSPFDEWMVIYRVDGNEFRVLSIAHGRRKPAFWRGRR